MEHTNNTHWFTKKVLVCCTSLTHFLNKWTSESTHVEPAPTTWAAMPIASHIRCPISPVPSHSSKTLHCWTSIWNMCLPPWPFPVVLSETQSFWMRSVSCGNTHPAASCWKTCFQNRSEPFWSILSILPVTRKMCECDNCSHNSSPAQALDTSGMDCVTPSFLQYCQPWISQWATWQKKTKIHPRQICFYHLDLRKSNQDVFRSFGSGK